jgi:hypothetical protein
MRNTSQTMVDMANVRRNDLDEASGRRGSVFPTISEMADLERAAWSIDRALRTILVVLGAVAAVNIAVKVLL